MESEKSEDSVKSEHVSETNFKKGDSEGNTIKYRNNFKFEMASFKAGSLFATCKFCKQKMYFCDCILCEKCGEEECNCMQDETSHEVSVDSEMSTFEYAPLPPSLNQIESNALVEH